MMAVTKDRMNVCMHGSIAIIMMKSWKDTIIQKGSPM